MVDITERKLFLRDQIELPTSLKLSTREFLAGWNTALTLNAQQLEKKIDAQGWSFIKLAERLQASGVGETSQSAITSALRLALLRASNAIHAVQVEYIELTQYPWFFLARVRIFQCRILRCPVTAADDESLPAPIAPRQRRLPSNSDLLYPNFGSAMPQLKQMLISSKTAQVGPN